MKNFNTLLLQAIEKMLDKKLSGIFYDKTFPSVIYKKNENGTYQIIREGISYDVPCALGKELKPAQNVWVTIPCGMKNFKDMYISGIRGTAAQQSP